MRIVTDCRSSQQYQDGVAICHKMLVAWTSRSKPTPSPPPLSQLADTLALPSGRISAIEATDKLMDAMDRVQGCSGKRCEDFQQDMPEPQVQALPSPAVCSALK